MSFASFKVVARILLGAGKGRRTEDSRRNSGNLKRKTNTFTSRNNNAKSEEGNPRTELREALTGKGWTNPWRVTRLVLGHTPRQQMVTSRARKRYSLVWYGMPPKSVNLKELCHEICQNSNSGSCQQIDWVKHEKAFALCIGHRWLETKEQKPWNSTK